MFNYLSNTIGTGCSKGKLHGPMDPTSSLSARSCPEIGTLIDSTSLDKKGPFGGMPMFNGFEQQSMELSSSAREPVGNTLSLSPFAKIPSLLVFTS